MRIVHTADWHVGRAWKNVNRLDETARVIDHLGRYLQEEMIDLLLVAGDVFDIPNPGADAEKLVFEFFRFLASAGIPAVVIAGNHDSPGRLDAWATLTDLAGVQLVGRPRAATKGGVREIHTRSGETALVAALPFASPGVFVSGLELAADETEAKAKYADKFKGAVAHLATAFRTDCVNVLMAHTHLDGAVMARSERQVHLGEDWAATPQAMPSTAHYVALGHIHRPQRIEAAPVPTEYAGSPLQLDFGEVSQKKTFVVLDVRPGTPARIEHIAYQGAKELHDLRLTLAEFEARAEELKNAGWLRVTVPLDTPDPDLARKVRALAPNALIIRPELPTMQTSAPVESREGKRPAELYREYHEREYGQPAEAVVEEAFAQLYEHCAVERGG